jgi:hypothetical protein
MELSIDKNTIKALRPDENGIIIIRPDSNPQQLSKLSKVIDILGDLSAKVK